MKNISEAIHYGPCVFMDTYDQETVFSSIDIQGRYSYGNQPKIAGWNLARFAETLLPLLHVDQEEAVKLAQDAVSDFAKLYQAHWLAGMRGKLGIFNNEAEDESLIEDLLHMMQKYRTDYTNTFRALTFDDLEEAVLFETRDFPLWLERWNERLVTQAGSNAPSNARRRNRNPALIPRNHRVEAALEAALEQGEYSVMERLLGVLSSPYAHTLEQAAYSTPPAPTSRTYRTLCGT